MNDHGWPPEDEYAQLIAEYALGVIPAEERAHVEAMAARDPGTRASIAAWQSCFDCWVDQLPASNPPSYVWEAIEAQLFALRTPEPPKRTRAWNRVGFWRWASVALAACLLVSVVTGLQPTHPARPTMLARLEQADGQTLFAATVQAGGRSILLVPTQTAFWQSQSAQAWVIPEGGQPRSLGLLPSNAAVELAVPSELLGTLIGGAVVAVSLEPPNGSPTGLPTGPVIAQGKISTL